MWGLIDIIQVQNSRHDESCDGAWNDLTTW